jgi:hypothetical protein
MTLGLQDLGNLIDVLISCLQKRLVALTSYCLVLKFFRLNFYTMACSLLMMMI